MRPSSVRLAITGRILLRRLSAQVQVEGKEAGVPPSAQTTTAQGTAKLTTLGNNLTVTTSSAVLPAVGLVWKIPAGSRYEQPSTTGLSHYLRHALFAGNEKESGLALARRSELCGADLTITNDRESITITVDCPHEETTKVMESISNMLLNFKLQHYQIPKVEAGVALDREIASSDVDSQLWEQAFSAAYRTGLGNSPLSNEINHAPIESVNTFLMTAMKRSGHVVAASGLGRLELSEPLKHIFTATVPKLQLVEGASKYFGGERRVEYNDGDDGKNHVLIAFGTSGAHNKSESHAVRIMAALIGSGQTVQHGRGQSHLDGIRELLAKNREISIAAHVRQYSDGGLMGIKISAPVEFEMKPVLESICKELNAIGTGRFATGALSGAKSRAAYEAIAELDTRLGQATALATNVLIYNAPLNIQADLASLHSLSSADFKAMASKIFSRKPVVVSLGRLASLPFADELSC